jgi:hypothetical protein
MMLCDFLRRPLTPSEYIGGGYPDTFIDSQVQDPHTRETLKNIMDNFLTNMPDLRVASRLSLIAAASGGRLNIVYARDFRYQPQTPDNLILLSHRKANPWVALFEERMNFRYDFDAKEYRAAIVNLAPKPGEEARYPVEWGLQTYALIAHLRKPERLLPGTSRPTHTSPIPARGLSSSELPHQRAATAGRIRAAPRSPSASPGRDWTGSP